MIPLRDIIPSRTTPVVTIAIIAINAVAWFYEVSLSDPELRAFIGRFGVVPAALEAPTLLSSMFLHGSWMHVIGNLWYLWIFGDNVEDRMGHGRYVLFYLLCGVGAAIGHVLAEPGSVIPTIGASGAIAGVMGAYFVLYPQSKVLTLIPLIIIWDVVELPAILLLGFWFLLQLVSWGSLTVSAVQASGGIAFVAHIAGFVIGALGVFVFRKRQPPVEWLV